RGAHRFPDKRAICGFARGTRLPARPIAHVLANTKNTNFCVCYNTVTALTEVSAKMQWVRLVPLALRSPDNSGVGCAAAAVTTGALELPPLYLAPHCGLRTASVMRNERSGKYAPRPPLCPSCAKTMRLARTTSRFGNLPDLYTYECRA